MVMVFEKKNLSINTRGTLPNLPYTALKQAILGTDYVLSVSFIAPKAAQTLNKKYRNKSYIPNTLSFPLTKKSGELIICRSVARREAKEFDHSYAEHLLFLMIHSMLHLKGLDHGGTMDTLEARYFKRFRGTLTT